MGAKQRVNESSVFVVEANSGKWRVSQQQQQNKGLFFATAASLMRGARFMCFYSALWRGRLVIWWPSDFFTQHHKGNSRAIYARVDHQSRQQASEYFRSPGARISLADT